MSWEQIGNEITFRAPFIEAKVGKTGLTVTVDVYRNDTEIVTAGSATEVGDGIYKYVLASGSVTVEGEYVAVFKTATDTVDAQYVYSLWVVGRSGVENLDALISSRLASAGYTAPLGAASTAAAVLDAVATDYNDAGSIGEKINAAGGAADPLTNQVPGAYAAGTAGAALGRMGVASVSVSSPVAANGDIEIIRSDWYDDDEVRPLEWTEDQSVSIWPILTAGTVEMNVYDADDVEIGSFAGSVITATGISKKVRVELSGTDTLSLPTGRSRFDIEVTLDTHKVTLVRATANVLAD